MAKNIWLLSLIFNKTEWSRQAESMIATLKEMAVKYPTSFGNWAMLILGQVAGINEITISGGTETEDFCKKIQQFYVPNRIIMPVMADNSNFPISEGKFSKSLTLIYLCKKQLKFPEKLM